MTNDLNQFLPLYLDLDTGKINFTEKSPFDNLINVEFIQHNLESIWVINHNQNSDKFIIWKIFDIDYNEIIPNSIEITDSNNITIRFSESLKGLSQILFF